MCADPDEQNAGCAGARTSDLVSAAMSAVPIWWGLVERGPDAVTFGDQGTRDLVNNVSCVEDVGVAVGNDEIRHRCHPLAFSP